MKLTHARISNFRNIEFKDIALTGKTTVFSGMNQLGKTNILNALYWAITGTDLNNKSDNSTIVPNSLKKEFLDGDTITSVFVETDVGTIERKLVFEKDSISQKVAINGLPIALKQADIEIDNMLGILPLTLNETKDFRVKRFLLNPNYINFVTQKALREFITKNLNSMDVFARELTMFSEKERLDKYGSFTNLDELDKSIAANIKGFKAQVDKWQIIYTYLKEFQPTNEKEIEQANNFYQQYRKDLMIATQDKSVAETLSVKVKLGCECLAKKFFEDINVVFMEMTSVGSYLEVCYPTLENGMPLNCGSASEKINVLSRFIYNFINNCDALETKKYPLFVDELESFDNDSFKNLVKELDTQIIGTKVSNDKSIVQESI